MADYDPSQLIYGIIDTIRLEFNDPVEQKKINNLLKNCYLIGGKAIADNNSDTDIYYYDKTSKANGNLKKLETIIHNTGLDDQGSFNIDLQPPLATDNLHSIKDSETTLTDYIFGIKKEKFTARKSVMNMLNLNGLFLTKLAILNDRDKAKDYEMLKIIYDRFNHVIPAEVNEAITEFGMETNLEKFMNYLNKEQK